MQVFSNAFVGILNKCQQIVNLAVIHACIDKVINFKLNGKIKLMKDDQLSNSCSGKSIISNDNRCLFFYIMSFIVAHSLRPYKLHIVMYFLGMLVFLAEKETIFITFLFLSVLVHFLMSFFNMYFSVE